MAQLVEERYAFASDWDDPQSGFTRTFHLIFYVRDGTLELYEPKLRKTFLKRTHVAAVRVNDLYIGSKVNVLGRQLLLKDYADNYTKNALEKQRERTLAIIKPDAVAAKATGKIFIRIEELGLQVGNLRMVHLTVEQAQEFYAEHKGKPFFNPLVEFMTSGPCIAIELLGDGAIKAWRTLIGPTKPDTAREQAPNSLRALYGGDNTHNATHGSDAVATAERELKFFFGSDAQFNTIAKMDGSTTLAVIKPHAIRDRNLGNIIDRILNSGFNISAACLVSLDRVDAEEFLEVYQGVIQEYPDLVTEIISGPCVALEISLAGGDGDGEAIVSKFREFCGPPDAEIARHLRKDTLRAVFGVDRIRNAVHCTDLVEDSTTETQYFFQLLQNK